MDLEGGNNSSPGAYSPGEENHISARGPILKVIAKAEVKIVTRSVGGCVPRLTLFNIRGEIFS